MADWLGGANANSVKGYVLKADVKHYFQEVNHGVLIGILGRRIREVGVIWLVRKILENGSDIGKGMPLGNYTSQFFANVYLNELDYFVKHILKARFYIRYVDDFVILHERKKFLAYCLERISHYLLCLKIELYPEKSKIFSLACGVDFLGYKIFFHYKKILGRNLMEFYRKLYEKIESGISKDEIIESLQGWIGYASWANSYNLRSKMIEEIIIFQNPNFNNPILT